MMKTLRNPEKTQELLLKLRDNLWERYQDYPDYYTSEILFKINTALYESKHDPESFSDFQ